MKILLVEDDFKLGQATKRLFEYEHCAVDWAQDGAEALKLLESSLECAYDVIVLDWMLPEINGLSLCRLMRNKYGYQGGIAAAQKGIFPVRNTVCQFKHDSAPRGFV